MGTRTYLMGTQLGRLLDECGRAVSRAAARDWRFCHAAQDGHVREDGHLLQPRVHRPLLPGHGGGPAPRQPGRRVRLALCRHRRHFPLRRPGRYDARAQFR